jgi:hypothetical protein
MNEIFIKRAKLLKEEGELPIMPACFAKMSFVHKFYNFSASYGVNNSGLRTYLKTLATVSHLSLGKCIYFWEIILFYATN